MKAVGVRELKAHLSGFLRDVQAGEVILVTDRGVVVAELRAPRHEQLTSDDAPAVLALLAETGDVTRAALPKNGWRWQVTGLGLPAGTARALLDELRGESDVP